MTFDLLVTVSSVRVHLIPRVANSHAYGVILTHLTCYSRTHAIDKFTHAFNRNHTHTHAILYNRK